MRGQETDHVISGPMRGFEKNCIRWRRQTSGHRDSMTDPAQRAESVKNERKEKNHIFSLIKQCNAMDPRELVKSIVDS